MSESVIMKDIQMAMTKLGHRLFRNNVAIAWAGRVFTSSVIAQVTIYPGDVLVRNARPIHAGLCNGSSDLIGWSSTGRFVAAEIKTPIGKLTDEQVSFLGAVQKSGGISFCARSVDEATQKISELN